MSKNLIQLFTADFLSMDKGMQEQIYKEFYMLVYPTIYFILRDHTLVEDLIQESFIRAIRKAPLLKEPEKYEGWLKKLTRNVTLNHLRKVKRNRDELDAEINLAPREYVNWVPDTNLEKEVELKMMQEAICNAPH
ncbi:RNA polymerase sigma factor, partial [Paenibacillus larvae]|uniref:RNA polymerase sigma factor n=1 Tax=Paenibacillus larvae TaxID=1464 RepID=UPI00227F42F3